MSKDQRKLPAAVRSAIISAINHARLQTAHFGGVHDEKLVYRGEVWQVDNFVKEQVRLHHGSWIAGPLMEVIEYDDGGELPKGWDGNGGIKPHDSTEYKPMGPPRRGEFPLQRTVVLDQADDVETRCIIAIGEIMKDLHTPDDRARVLSYMAEKNKA